MNFIKKIMILFMACMLEWQTTAMHVNNLDELLSENQDPKSMICMMEQAIESTDKACFENLLKTYINVFGQIYEKQLNALGMYKTVYCISSKYDRSQPITPTDHALLVKILDRAVKYEDWNKTLTLQLSVFNLKTLLATSKLISLHEIINAMRSISPPVQYSQSIIITVTTLSVLALAGSLYYFAQQNPEIIRQGTYTIRYGWEDLQDNVHHILKIFSNAQNYEQFEKEHDLLSDDMTKIEREQRFREWQIGEQIQQKINNQMKQVKRFEEKLNLRADNMLDNDRIKIFNEWKKQERSLELLRKKMLPVEKFEKKHGLLSENMTEKAREQRLKDWQKGEQQQQIMNERLKPVKAFEEKHNLLSQDMLEKERIKRYNEWQRGNALQQALDKKIKEVESYEKRHNLSHANMHYEDRIKKVENLQFMNGFKRWQKEHPWTTHRREWSYEKRTVVDIKVSEKECIEKYMRRTDSIQRSMYENDNLEYFKNFINK